VTVPVQPLPAPGERLADLRSHAYERTRRAIAMGELPPSIVIREGDLARQYAMSKTPVREALQQLHSEGFIRPAGAGRYVALELGPKQLSDIYQVREALVGLAARLAAEHRTRVDVARLEDLLEAIDRACEAEDDEEADALVRTFYHMLGDAGGNEYLSLTLARVTDLFRYKALAVTHPEWREQLRQDHRNLVDAIARQDVPRAEAFGRHIIAKSLALRIDDLRRNSEAAG
jgi:DNA-binding GntR family transcriptional regulator